MRPSLGNQGVNQMDLRKFILEQIAAAKREDDEVSLQLLQALFNQLENPVSAQSLFMSAPIVNRKS